MTVREAQRSRVTIGTIGHPNAGKSSVINALTGKKVVSVSRQPGHTKILQTLLINETTILCDCPGLVFPAIDMPRELQVLSGIFPIPQTREPMAAVQYLAECIPLEDVLEVSPPQQAHDAAAPSQLGKSKGAPGAGAGAAGGKAGKGAAAPTRDTYPWSAVDICEAYARKRGFTVSHGRYDANRAAQAILYAVADGKIPFYFEPPLL